MTDAGNNPDFAPLQGIRVLDFCTNIAGPFGAMILAQLGADVVKVESPGGDDSRGYASKVNDISVVHSYVNVGKRSVVIDLKQPEGHDAALRLIASADVVLQSMRPGTMDRLGLGQDAAREVNPEILYYDVNGFGAGAVGAPLPGYDPLVQAFTGIMEMNGFDDSPPTRCAPSVVDLGTGQWVAMGVMAALMARQAGQTVHAMETALVDTGFSLAAYQATSAYVSGKRPPRGGSGNPIAAPYQCYTTQDGYLLIAAANQRLWLAVTRALEAPALADDPRFETVADRSGHRNELEQEINAILRNRRTEEWLPRFRSERVPVGEVLGLEEAIRTEVAEERRTLQDSDGVPLVRLPWLADGQKVPWARPAPRLGEHTEQVLRELGYSAEQVTDLEADGAATGALAPSGHRATTS